MWNNENSSNDNDNEEILWKKVMNNDENMAEK